VPVDHLLARLEVDGPVMARRLVELLFNSYMPVDKPLDVQVSRAIQFVRSNPGAARKFYLHAYHYLSVFPTSQFVISFLVVLVIKPVNILAELQHHFPAHYYYYY